MAAIAEKPLKTEDILRALDLEKYRYRFPRELSGGQQQRVAIARAMVKNPKLLLCDELTGALDTKSSRSVLKFIERINRRYGTTTLIITHNEGEILISAGYAEENGVKQGDKLKISGKEYTVVGTFLRPDYLYMVENLTDDYKNVTTFFLAYMTTGEFDARFGGGSINYMDQINRLCRCVYGAPLVFLICSDERKTWRSHTEPGYTTGEMDCSIVCTHMMLEAWEQGLGSVWVRLFDVQAVAKAFDLPPYIKPICLLPVGYASGDAVPYAPWDNVYREISEFAEVL